MTDHRTPPWAAPVNLELESVERELSRAGRPGGPVGDGVELFLARPGKRIRPTCVLLAAGLGDGGGEAAIDLAVGVELLHSATLLHDDIIDDAPTRRGVPTVSQTLGGSTSLLSGDWLLMQAFARVERARVGDSLAQLFAAVEEMIAAESLQMQRRERPSADRAGYFRIAAGKTASLFRWALARGGAAGGLDERAVARLDTCGYALGIAFQVVDNLLDLSAAAETGKAPFLDLQQGKLTYPTLVALEREPALIDDVRALASPCLAADERADRTAHLVARLQASGAVAATVELVERRVATALAAIGGLPDGPAKAGIQALAEATAGALAPARAAASAPHARDASRRPTRPRPSAARPARLQPAAPRVAVQAAVRGEARR